MILLPEFVCKWFGEFNEVEADKKVVQADKKEKTSEKVTWGGLSKNIAFSIVEFEKDYRILGILPQLNKHWRDIVLTELTSDRVQFSPQASHAFALKCISSQYRDMTSFSATKSFALCPNDFHHRDVGYDIRCVQDKVQVKQYEHGTIVGRTDKYVILWFTNNLMCFFKNELQIFDAATGKCTRKIKLGDEVRVNTGSVSETISHPLKCIKAFGYEKDQLLTVSCGGSIDLLSIDGTQTRNLFRPSFCCGVTDACLLDKTVFLLGKQFLTKPVDASKMAFCVEAYEIGKRHWNVYESEKIDYRNLYMPYGHYIEEYEKSLFRIFNTSTHFFICTLMSLACYTSEFNHPPLWTISHKINNLKLNKISCSDNGKYILIPKDSGDHSVCHVQNGKIVNLTWNSNPLNSHLILNSRKCAFWNNHTIVEEEATNDISVNRFIIWDAETGKKLRTINKNREILPLNLLRGSVFGGQKVNDEPLSICPLPGTAGLVMAESLRKDVTSFWVKLFRCKCRSFKKIDKFSLLKG